MKTKSAFIAVCLFLSGCVPSTQPLNLPRESRQEEINIDTQSYSIRLKSADRWLVSEIIEQYEGVILTREKKPPYCRILIIRKRVSDDAIEGQTAREMADAVRAREKQGMIELGVKKGLYRLKDLTMGEHVLGGKTYYSMTYQTTPRDDWGYETASLYLYFPKPRDNAYYILAHFSQTYVHARPKGPSCRGDFLNILKNLTIK